MKPENSAKEPIATELAEVQTLQPPFATTEAAIDRIAISPDGRRVAAVHAYARKVTVWDLVSGKPVGNSSYDHEAVIDVVFGSNSRTIITGSNYGVIQRWNLQSKQSEPEVLIQQLPGGFKCFSADGKIAVAGWRGDQFQFFNLEGKAIAEPFQGPTISVAFTPSSSHAVSSNDGKLQIWQLDPAYGLIAKSEAHQAAVCSFAFSSNGSRIASADAEGAVYLWGFFRGVNLLIKKGEGHSNAVSALAFSPDGKKLASGSADKTICLWEIVDTNLNLLTQLRGHEDEVSSVKFTSDSSTIVSASLDGTIRLWDVKTGQSLPNLADRVKSKVTLIPPNPKNDLAKGPDCLNIETEVHALAEVLMMRELEPPLAVGVLGGWGSGKSFGMHLIQQRINAIRSQELTEEQAWGNDEPDFEKSRLFPYVGHIYQIQFDAWTYAKADLWSSLMQTIFYEFNRQLTLEKQIEGALGKVEKSPLEGGEFWAALNEMSEEDRQVLLRFGLSEITSSAESSETSFNAFEAWQEAVSSQEVTDLLWDTLSKLRISDTEQLEQTTLAIEQEKKKLQEGLEETEKEARRKAIWRATLQQDLEKFLGSSFDEIQEQIQKKLKAQGETLDTQEGQKALDAEVVKFILNSFKPSFWDSLRQVIRRHWLTGIVFLGGLVLTILAPFLQSQLNSLLQRAGILSVLVSGVSIWEKTRKGRAFIIHKLKDFQEDVKLIDSYEAELKEKRQQGSIIETEIKIKKLETQAEQLRQRVGLTANYSSLGDFVTARLEADLYNKQLGLMQQVQRDLADLSSHFTCPNEKDRGKVQFQEKREKLRTLFPRGPARVVLYIDDLDRCPPNRVVEVLEAVQLLLKTPLFIVVLAIDDRYIARALEKVYSGVLTRKGHPSGIDYLEKIIQLPYRMRAINPTSLDSYLKSQIDYEEETKPENEIELSPSRLIESENHTEQEIPVDNLIQTQTSNIIFEQFQPNGDFTEETIEDVQDLEEEPESLLIENISQVTKFTQKEFETISRCCKHVDLSPRTAKRLINIFKILKIIWSRSKEPGANQLEDNLIKQTVIAFLALSGRYPDLMRHAFAEIDMHFEHTYEQDSDELNIELLQILLNLNKPAPHSDIHARREWQRFQHDVRQVIPDSLTLLQMKRNTFNLVLSFCFVGDIGYDPNDFVALTARNGQANPELLAE